MEINNENSTPADDQEASEGEESGEGEESEQEHENYETEVRNEQPVASAAPPVDTELENLYQMFPNFDKTIVSDMYRMNQGDTGMAAQQLLEIQGDREEQPNSSPPAQDNATNVPVTGQNEVQGNLYWF